MNKQLIDTLDRFLEIHGISDSTFGLLVCNDSHLIKRIRDGKTVRRSTILKIKNYINSHGESP